MKETNTVTINKTVFQIVDEKPEKWLIGVNEETKQTAVLIKKENGEFEATIIN